MKEKKHAFTKTHKLNSPSEYANVFKGAERSTDDLLTVLARKKNLSGARLGLAIAKKNVKRAVKRNAIKRVVRESFRQQKEHLSGYDFVILCRHKAASASKKELATSINRHWIRFMKSE
ncbi:MAG: ribonuclease P protein component [Cycloclasticus pugetii]|uniref:ribonuclease P protein component n=1 Tax=Cycloclasticus TaxID=34067 RepID=UPI000526349E|nr:MULTISPECIES: ribonuclease P protein component [Cycloclasticus]ATI02182.1 ribonuclease P protein component [Cycloclasticus sp. PY97N]MBV1897873.1 ribonuclease P protein component [Cycloclasticus sp.]MDF1829492.1 ribonuclease P protein component [Cycloclasticus pugetii]PHR50195.1 MAG: ribonuclease P protein component [Cycloclasticus sp.]